MANAVIAVSRSWYGALNRAQWVTVVASNLGWLFDGYETYALFLTVGFALRQLLDPAQFAQIPVYSGVIIALTLLGFLTANFVGRKLVEFGENILNRMPVVRPIYKSLKQIFETLFSNAGSNFRRVGVVEFPGPGMWSLVFLSQPPGAAIAARLPEAEHVAAFMPCTPNPTTGFFFYVPRGDVIDLDISVEQAMQLLMSAGIIQPGAGSDADTQGRLAALAETARTAQAARQAEPTAAK